MEDHQLNNIIFFVVLVAFSAFFSSSETAFTSASRIRLQHRAEQGEKKANLAIALQDTFDSLLSTILIGNNLVNIAASSIATLFFLKLFPIYGATIATLVTTVLLLLFGEITPKLIGKVYPEDISIRFAPILNFFMKLLTPFVWLFQLWQNFVARIIPMNTVDNISEEELLSIVDEARLDGTIEWEEHRLVKAALEFDDREISSILTPRVDVIGFNINESFEEIEQLYLHTPFSRLLVYDDSGDNVIGTMHAKDFFRFLRTRDNENRRYEKMSDLITKPLFVPQTVALSNLLESMQREHTHIGIIVDEYGQMIGIATMEDVIEELVGEIWDESDVVRSDLRQLSGEERYLVLGTYSLEKLFELFHMKSEEEWHSNTVSGFLIEQFDYIPGNNEELFYKDLKFTVVNAQRQRVNEVIVERMAGTEEDEMDVE